MIGRVHCPFPESGSRVVGVSQCTCVQLDGLHSSFLIVCFSYTKDYPGFQHLVVNPSVCSMPCSCDTNVHLIPATGDDEVYLLSVSRPGIRPGGLECILMFEPGVLK